MDWDRNMVGKCAGPMWRSDRSDVSPGLEMHASLVSVTSLSRSGNGFQRLGCNSETVALHLEESE